MLIHRVGSCQRDTPMPCFLKQGGWFLNISINEYCKLARFQLESLHINSTHFMNLFWKVLEFSVVQILGYLQSIDERSILPFFDHPPCVGFLSRGRFRIILTEQFRQETNSFFHGSLTSYCKENTHKNHTDFESCYHIFSHDPPHSTQTQSVQYLAGSPVDPTGWILSGGIQICQLAWKYP